MKLSQKSNKEKVDELLTLSTKFGDLIQNSMQSTNVKKKALSQPDEKIYYCGFHFFPTIPDSSKLLFAPVKFYDESNTKDDLNEFSNTLLLIFESSKEISESNKFYIFENDNYKDSTNISELEKLIEEGLQKAWQIYYDLFEKFKLSNK